MAVLTSGNYTAAQLNALKSLDQPSANGAVKIAIDPRYRVVINSSNQVTVEVKLPDQVTGVDTWQVGAQYAG